MQFSFTFFATTAAIAFSSTSALSQSTIESTIEAMSTVCSLLVSGSFGEVMCDFSNLPDYEDMPPSRKCNPDPMNGGNLTLIVDLSLKECPNALSVCANSPSALMDLLKLVRCLLASSEGLRYAISSIIDGAIEGLRDESSQSLVLNGVLLLAFTIVKKVIQVLYLEAPILISVLITAPVILVIILFSAAVGLSVGVTAIGGPLAIVVMVAGVIVVPIVAVICVLVLILVIALQPILSPLSVHLIVIISQLVGITNPHETIDFGQNYWTNDPKDEFVYDLTSEFLVEIPVQPSEEKYLMPVLEVAKKIVAFIAPVAVTLLEWVRNSVPGFNPAQQGSQDTQDSQGGLLGGLL